MDWDYLRGFFVALERGWLKFSPESFDHTDPALMRDLLVLAAEDRFYEMKADEKASSPPSLADELRRKAKHAAPLESMY